MYTVDDETLLRARAVVAAVARELRSQTASGSPHPVDLQELVRGSASVELREGGEADYVAAIADRLERTSPITDLFPRRRRGTDR